MNTLRQQRSALATLMFGATLSWSTLGFADTIYKSNSGTGTFLDRLSSTLGAPAAFATSYAEGVAITPADVLALTNLVSVGTTFRVSSVQSTNLSIAGILLTNSGGDVTIANGTVTNAGTGEVTGLVQTLTLGAAGIDMSAATRNLVLQSDVLGNTPVGSLTVATSSSQNWTVRNGLSLSFSNAPLVLGHNVTVGFTAGNTGGTAGAVNINGSISGSGNLVVAGMSGGSGGTVTLGGDNASWTGTTSVSGGARLNLDYTGAAQNKLRNDAIISLNRGQLNLQGTGSGTEVIGGVSLGQGLNLITKSQGSAVLQANNITRATGAGLNVGNIGTVAASSFLTTDTLNSNGTLGTWAVAINALTGIDWVKNSTNAADGAVVALLGTDYTTQNATGSWVAGQNILVNGSTSTTTESKTVSSVKVQPIVGTSAVIVNVGDSFILTLNDGSDGGGIIRNQAGTTTIGSANIGAGFLTAGAADGNADTLRLWNVQSTMTVNSRIQNNGGAALSLFLGGAGTVRLTAANTYSGGTTIAAGTLTLGNNTVASDGASLGGGSDPVVNFGTLIIDKTANAFSLPNPISGTGGLTINRGNITLTGANTYTGDTTFGASATLTAGGAGLLSGDSRVVLNAASSTLDLGAFSNSIAALSGGQSSASVAVGGGTLTLTGSDLARPGADNSTLSTAPQTYAGGISGTGSLVKNGAFVQQFSAGGALSFTGPLTINAGEIITAKALATNAVTLNGNGALTSNVAAVVNDTVPVTLAGAGSRWTIGANFNQSVGSLTGVAGSRVIAGSGATLTVGNNTGSAKTFDGIISGLGNVVVNAASPWELTGGNNYTGSTTISQGTLRIGSGSLLEVLSDRTALILANAAGVTFDLNGKSETIGSLSGGGAAGGSVVLGATGRLTVGKDNSSTAFGGVISGGTAATTVLTKVGNGTLTLSGTNTFVGNVVIRGSGGGLTLSGATVLADTVGVHNTGAGTTLTILGNEVLGPVTGGAGTILALGSNTLTANYTNSAPVNVSVSTADTDNTIRVIKNINTAGLQAGQLINQPSGTGITNAGSYIVQILSGDSILINQLPGGTASNITDPINITTAGVLGSQVTGSSGGFVKDGPGLMILSGSNSFNGSITINNGTLRAGGGIWTGSKYAIQDTLGDGSPVIFAGTGTQSLEFAQNATNLAPYDRIPSLSGGSAGSTVVLSPATGATGTLPALAVGNGNASFVYNGNITGLAGTLLVKEGAGTFTWNNPAADTPAAGNFAGTLLIDAGGVTTGGTGMQSTSTLQMQNNNTVFTSTVTDALGILVGGAGVTRPFANNQVGALAGNYIAGGAPGITLNAGTTFTTNTATSSAFNGVISGGGGFIKQGTSVFELRGANTYTGLTTVGAGTLRMGFTSGAAGLGAAGSPVFGTLAAGSSLNLTGGTFDLNNSTQSIIGLGAGSSGGSIALGSGTLTFSAQTAQSSATTFTSNVNGTLNINGASTLTLSAASNAFNGRLNVGNGQSLTLNGANTNQAKISLGTGSTLTLSAAQSIAAISGAGTITAASGQTLTLTESRSGAVGAPAFTGLITGATALSLGATSTGMGGLTLTRAQTYTGGTGILGNSLLNLNYTASGAADILSNSSALSLGSARIRLYKSAASPSIVDAATAATSLLAGLTTVESFAAFTAETATTQTAGKGAVNLGTVTQLRGGTLLVAPNSAAVANANTAGTGILPAWAVFNGTDWAVSNTATAAITGLATYSTNTFGTNLNTDVTANSAGATTNTLRFNTKAALIVTNAAAATIATGGILVTANVGANTTTIAGAGAISSGTNAELFLQQFNPLGDLVLTNIGGTNTIITKSGGGRAIITNDMAGSGTTFIDAGILQLGSGGTTGGVGTGAILDNAVLALNRTNTLTLTQIISGFGGIQQIGSGRTILSAANTFSGRVNVAAGTLEITSSVSALGVGASVQNVGANLTSIRAGGTLDINIAGSIPEALVLDGGTVLLRAATATTLASAALGGSTVPLTLLADSTFSLGAGANVTHVISAPIIGLPGAGLTVNGVASGSTLALTSASNSLTGAITIGSSANLQVGSNSAGTLGTRGAVTDNGQLIFNGNDAHLVIGNAISGSGAVTVLRNNVYFTGATTNTPGLTVGGTATGFVADGATLNLGNDTYTGSAGILTLQAPTDASVNLRTHRNDDITIGSLTLNPNNPSATARNTTFIRQGLGTVTLNNITVGITTAGGGTQRAILQSEAGGNLVLTGTLAAGATNLMNIINNNAATGSTLAGALIVGGSASNTYDGVLSGNNIWVFSNTGTTTLTGVNTFSTANTYIQRGTVVLNNTSAANAIDDNNDTHVLRGATLQTNTFETLGTLFTAKGGTMNVGAGTALTLDDNTNHALFGTLSGSGNINFSATGGAAWYAVHGTSNTLSGKVVIGSTGQTTTVQVTSLADAGLPSSLGTGGTIALGQRYVAQEARLEYIGPGSTTNRTLELGGGPISALPKTSGSATTASPTLTVTDVSQITAGMVITGSGVTAGTTVLGVDSLTNTLTLSANATVPAATALSFFASQKTTAAATLTTTTIPIADTSGLSVGMFVQGTGVQLGSKITAIGAGNITIDNPATVAASATLSFYTVYTVGASTTLRIAANGTGPLVLNGPVVSATDGDRLLLLHGQNAMANTINGVIDQGAAGKISLSVNPKTADNDMYGFSRWVFANAGNNFSGDVSIDVGTLELAGNLKTGVETTSVLGNLSVARTIDLGTNDFNGRRYDNQGNGDNLGAAGGTSAMGTIIFNDPNPGTATLGSNISFTQSFSSTTNPGRGQIVNDGVKVINIAGSLTSGANGSRAWVLDGSNTGINTISGVISDNNDTISLIKEGSGTWRLAGANTFQGGVTITRGILQVAGGGAVDDAATVAVSDVGADGLSTINHATFQVVGSETIGELTGSIGATTILDAGQTLTMAGAGATYSGVITGAGGLAKTLTIVNGSASSNTFTATNKNTYTGVTTIGNAIAISNVNAGSGVAVYHLANGGLASGIGAAGSAASNLVFNNGGNTAGGLIWQGFTDQSTDRLFTMGAGAGAASIIANGTVIGTSAPKLTFSNTGALAFLAANQTATLQLGGSTLSDNTFSPQITNNGSANVTLSKTGGGIWVVTNAANSYGGGTVIGGGTLAITSGTALGSGTVTLRGGAGTGLQLRGSLTLANGIAYSPLAAATTDGGINATGGSSTINGQISFNRTNGSNTNDPATAVLSNFRVSVDAGATLDLAGKLTGNGLSGTNGTGTIVKFGQGTLVLSGANDYSAGNFQVAAGTLRLNYASQNNSKLLDSGTLTLGGAGVITGLGADDNVAGQTAIIGNTGARIEIAGGSHTEVVGAVTVGVGANAIVRSSGSSVLQMNVISRSIGGTIDFGADAIATTDTNNGTGGILGAYATVAKTNWATSVGSGAADTAITALAASGYNNGLATDTYGTGFNTDVINFTAVAANAESNTIRFNKAGGGTLTLGGEFNLQTGGLLVTPNSGNVIVTGGAIQNSGTGAGVESLVIHQHSASALQINSVIQNNSGIPGNAQVLTKSGAGKVFLNAVNTQTGAVNLNEGEIQVGGTIAAPTVATNATLGGGNALNIATGATLTFNSTNTDPYNFGTITGGGLIQTLAGNTQTLLMDDDNGNFVGEIIVGGGTTLRAALNNNALGSNRGRTTLQSGAVLQIDDARALGEWITMSQGTTIRVLTPTLDGSVTSASLSGVLTLNNTAAAGAVLDTQSSSGTINSSTILTISGLIQTANGFTKTGGGQLVLSGNNFTDVIDGATGATGANKTPSLFGQVRVNAGELRLGNARALGATGVGNETIVASGATLDLRGNALNFADDSNPTREIISISGTGLLGLGALRNTTGTAQFSNLTLAGNASISGGGIANGSILSLSTFDTNTNNGSTLEGNFTRNQPTINGGGFTLTVFGNRTGQDNVILQDPSFSSALGKLVISEGGLRIDKAVGPVDAFAGITASNITNGIEIAYGGRTAADLTNPSLGAGANVGARLNFLNNWDIHHTVAITMNGVTAAANGGVNYIDTAAATIPSSRTYLDGAITVTGAAVRNVFNIDSATSNNTVTEQGNLTASLQSKLIVGGVIAGSGGFTKTGFRELRLTNNNTFSGDVNVLRYGFTSVPWQTNTVTVNGVDYQTLGDAEGWAEYGLTLSGLNGAISGTANINLERRGMITLDNTTRLDATSGVPGGNNNNRINDAANILLNHGWLRINGGTTNNTESLATAFGAKMQVLSGTNLLDFYPTDGAGTAMTLTIGEISRAAGAVLRIQDLDSTSNFSAASGAESVRVALTSIGTLGQTGAASGATDNKIVIGILGGSVPHTLGDDLRQLAFNNGGAADPLNQARNLQLLSGSQFMTWDGGFLRPLDDSEYFVPTDGLLTAANGAAGQNVDVNDASTIMSQSLAVNSLRFGPLADNNGSGGAINAGTTLTSYTAGHAVQLFLDGAMTIGSGMISSAYFTVGNSADLRTVIAGGSLDFGTREAIINNQNGMVALTTGAIATGNLEIRSNISGSGGLTKTGLAQVVLDGSNTYTGLTTISDGTLFGRNGKGSFGANGNGIVVIGNGQVNTGSGVNLGTAALPKDILVKALQGSQQVFGVNDDVTNWFGDLIIDNIDAASQTLFTPIINLGGNATAIFNGDIYGGPTAITNDVTATDSRIVQVNGTGNLILRGQVGDRGVAGAAAPIGNPISTLPSGSVLPAGFTLPAGTVVTNENEVLRVNLNGSAESNYFLEQQWNSAGRLTTIGGFMLINYDPAAPGNDGTGFYSNSAISKIPNADSNTSSFTLNGGTSQQGFALGNSGGTLGGIFLTKAGQNFNMSSWTANGGTKVVGGLNTSGTVTYGDGFGNLSIATSSIQLYAMAGGTVMINQRLTGSPGTAPDNLGFIKTGRGTVILANTDNPTASDSTMFLSGGTLILNHDGGSSSPVNRVGNTTTTFGGGVLWATPHASFHTSTGMATSNSSSVIARFNTGGTEIIAEANNGRDMIVNIGNNNANGTTPAANLTRQTGATVNFVEYTAPSGGVPVITLDFNATTTAVQKNRVISWATYGTQARTAVDFAMTDAAGAVPLTSGDTISGGLISGNDIRAFGRAADEYINDVSLWTNGIDASENGGAGFFGTIGSSLTVNTIRFDTPGESAATIASGQALALLGDGVAGGILVSSNVGASNKTIAGGVLDAALMTFTGNLTNGANTVSNVSSTANLVVGMPVKGVGIASGTTITAISGNALTLSANATADSTGAGLFASTPEVVIHQYATGNLTISSGIGKTQTPVSGVSTTNGSANLGIPTAGLSVGMAVVGTNIPAGTTILRIVDANNLVMSANASATGTGITVTVGSAMDVTVTGPSTTTNSTFGTTGAVVFANAPNGFAGRLVVGGAAVEFADVNALGINPAASVTNQITLNGGTLRYTGAGYADLLNRGVRIEGNGGVIDVIDSNGEVRISGDLNSQGTFRGDLIKMGAGTLTLGSTNNANFGGLIDVRQGTLRYNDTGTGGAATVTAFGSNQSYADGTIFRTGADFAIQPGGAAAAGNDYTIEEWITFEGTNYVTVGTINANAGTTPSGFSNPGSLRTVNLQGVLTMGGAVTIDTVNTQVLRLNNAGGYMTGSGDIVKDGQGQLEFRGNTPDWTGGLTIKQGTVVVANQGDALGTGYLANKTIVLGSNERQGVVSLLIQNPDNIQSHTFEINNPIEVVYSRAQTKRIGIDNISNGDSVSFNGDITVNDNLILLMRDTTISVGGEQAYVNFNGRFKDGAVTSGNIVVQTDDSDGTANNLTNGRTYGYALLNADNSAWTGDLTISTNVAYNQDNTAIVRLNHAQALTAANEVTMNFNSILQVGGGSRTIGSLTTSGGNGPYFGDAGTMSASTNGSSEIIENAASTPGTLTIHQSTPAAVEAVWDAKFRDGTLNSTFFAPGANVSLPSAALSIVKSGPGWATLTLDNDYTGATTIAGGTLQVGRAGVGDTGAPSAAGLTVQSGGTLAGTGVVQGAAVVQSGGSVAPGDLAGTLMGTLTVNGPMTLQTGSTTTLQVQRATYNNAGYVGGTDYPTWLNGIPADSYSSALRDPVMTTQHDAINILGAINWAGGRLVLSNNGYTPNVGDIFDLLDWVGAAVGSINVGSQFRTGTETGTDLDLFELGGNYRWDTSLFNSNGILAVVVPGIIPEPGRLLLLLVGMLGIVMRRRRMTK